MVYYRKYRPQKIEELDSESVRGTLFGLFNKLIENIPHALLFTGSKGLGKTSTARIVAKIVNCERKSKIKNQKSKIEPCNECEQCVSITKGSNLDVMEIDGASNRGIDEIRDLREKIKLAPVSANKKVYIIDEVHMLTTDAFNALLKTLEEPPAHALFILCTTEAHKLPATIVSRCFQVPFKKAINPEIVSSLLRIVKGEKLDIDKDALEYIATLSDGAFRDASKILEEVALQAGKKKITKELVENKYHVSGIKYYVSEMIIIFQNKDAKEGFRLISKISESGTDFKFFIEQLIETLHSQLLSQIGGEEGGFTVDEIKRLIELLNNAHQQIKYSILPQLPLELMIVEWYSNEEKGDEKVSQVSKVSKGISSPSDTSDTSRTPSDTSSLWNNFIDTVKKHNNLTAGVLRSCQLGEQSNGSLTITTKFKFHKEKLDSSISVLEKAAQELTGNPLKVSVELKV